MGNQAEISCTSCTSELQRIRKLVKQSCNEFGLESSRTNAVVLAIDEACANVIRHGYQYSKKGYLCIEVYQEQDHGVFLIKDHCPQICEMTLTPKEDKPLEPGGLGLHLIHDVMDSVKLIPHQGDGNWLELKIKL